MRGLKICVTRLPLNIDRRGDRDNVLEEVHFIFSLRMRMLNISIQ